MIHNDAIQTLADLATVQAEQFPTQRALIFQDQALTYGQLRQRSDQTANALLAAGSERGRESPA